MNKYGYTLKKHTAEHMAAVRYHKNDLELMSVFQLREICRKEKIIHGIINPMDREELIHVILRYRGAKEEFLIQKENENGLDVLQTVLNKVKIQERYDFRAGCSSKITVYEGLAIGYYDELTLPYDKRLVGTNAFVVSRDMTVCAILNIVARGDDTDTLYLTKAAELSCREAERKDYALYCMGQRESEIFYRIYNSRNENICIPEYIEVYRIPLLDFEVKAPGSLAMPIAIDFGTANTTVGVYLDKLNYTMFYNPTDNWKETPLLPSVVGVLSIEEGKPHFVFGYDAIRLADSSYIDEGFCVFYDIKRWISDYEGQEEITDRQGRRVYVSRKEILKAYFEHVIQETRNRFKCEIHNIHISCPVKQKAQFARLFKEILSDYSVEEKDMLDEGVSVLYNTISSMIKSETIEYGEEYKALMIDCGGGTTDLCSCRFRVWDKRVAYRIEINTSYENGDTDFGGNNLTYRIMQYLKVAIVNALHSNCLMPEKQILGKYDIDVFRFVDKYGVKELYRELENSYEEAESYLPTQFQKFENKSRQDYFMVKNNFYALFHLAESVKKVFYESTGVLRIALASQPIAEAVSTWIPVDKWKLSVCKDKMLSVVKEFPLIHISIYELELLLKGDIYGIIRRFMEKMYEDGALEEYSIIRLTGQSCKIGLFRDALKEFVPGKTIQFRQEKGNEENEYGLKMTCVNGALKYLKDKKYGYADIVVRTEVPALPYRITAYTHDGEEIVLIRHLQRGGRSGMISRNMEDLTLKLYLMDMDGRERYQYSCYATLEEFEEMTYEEIRARHGEHIRQADTDDIVDNEVRFFVWLIPSEWAFLVVPIYRKKEKLYLGKEEKFYFENEGWVQNFFDGLK